MAWLACLLDLKPEKRKHFMQKIAFADPTEAADMLYQARGGDGVFRNGFKLNWGWLINV